MLKKSDIAVQFKKHKSTSVRGLANQYKNTELCEAFYAGDFMAYKDRMQFAKASGGKAAAMVQFNKVKPYVNGVKGFMAQNRRRAKYNARTANNQAQVLYSKYSNALADFTRGNTNADQVETQQDGDMVTVGYGGVETAVTYGDGYSTTDPNGEILMGRLDPKCLGWDPYAQGQPNLLGARWMYYHRDYEIEEAVSLFSESSEEDFEPANEDDVESGYTYFKGGGRYDKIKESGVEWANQQLKQVRVYYYQWFEIERFYRAENPLYTLKNPQAVQIAAMQLDIIAQQAETGEYSDMFKFDPRAKILTFDSATKEKLKETFGKTIEIFSFNRKVYYTAVISGQHVFTAYRSISQQGFSIKVKTGDYDAKNKIWTGLVNSMIDPVLYYCKALTELMFIIGANSKGGVMIEEGTVEDIAEFEAKYAKTDAVVEVSKNAISENRIRPKREAFVPTGYEQIISLSDAAITDVNGIDKSFLGQVINKEETATLNRQRIKQVMSILACYFDAITLFQKEQARLYLDMMKVYAENNSGSLFRILGDDGVQQFIQISADSLAAEYDVDIAEAPQTLEERSEYAELLSNIGDRLLSAGDQSGKVLYAIALKYTSLEQEDIQKATEVLVPKDNQIDPAYVKQLEQELQLAKNEITQAEVQKAKSTSALNIARTSEIDTGMKKTVAETAKILEEAKQTNFETHLAHKANASVSINI